MLTVWRNRANIHINRQDSKNGGIAKTKKNNNTKNNGKGQCDGRKLFVS